MDDDGEDVWPTVGPLRPGLPRAGLVAEVRRALAPLPPGAAALAACSGGPDSTACAFIVSEARPDLVLTLGHVRHGLRDDQQDADAVLAHARWLGVDCLVTSVDVRGGGGVEAAARAHRYAALRRQAASIGAGWILLGHTAEDQAETVLLRIARGTGLAGLAAMAPVRGGLVRPLLRLRRDDVARFVLLEGLPVVRDPMNSDPRVARVRVREEVLPRLVGIGPDPVGAIARLADLARADGAALDRLAGDVAAQVLVRHGPVVALRDTDLAALEPALAARVLRAAVTGVRSGDDPPTAAQVAALAELSVGSAVDLPDVLATRGGGWVALAPRDVPVSRPVPLLVPGRTAWPATGVVLDVHTEEEIDLDGQLRLVVDGGWTPPQPQVDADAVPPGGRSDAAVVVVGRLPERLVVRPRRAGDRIVTAAGTRKLQDVFVDAGVPRALRDHVPVVSDDDHVLWVPGVAVDARLRRAGVDTPGAVLSVRSGGAAGS